MHLGETLGKIPRSTKDMTALQHERMRKSGDVGCTYAAGSDMELEQE